MTSLVADYDSNSDDCTYADAISDEEELTRPLYSYSQEKVSNIASSSDSSDSDSSDSDTEESVPLPNPLANPLSKVNCSDETTDESSGSVFTSSFELKEKAKISILEKHVKVTDAPEQVMKNEKKICWRFTKGKCRFGKNCKYSHKKDSIPLKNLSEDMSDNHERRSLPSKFMQRNLTDKDEDEDSYLANKKRKVKAGVSNSLAPPKKAMIPLQKFRSVERPWTVSK